MRMDQNTLMDTVSSNINAQCCLDAESNLTSYTQIWPGVAHGYIAPVARSATYPSTTPYPPTIPYLTATPSYPLTTYWTEQSNASNNVNAQGYESNVRDTDFGYYPPPLPVVAVLRTQHGKENPKYNVFPTSTLETPLIFEQSSNTPSNIPGPGPSTQMQGIYTNSNTLPSIPESDPYIKQKETHTDWFQTSKSDLLEPTPTTIRTESRPTVDRKEFDLFINDSIASANDFQRQCGLQGCITADLSIVKAHLQNAKTQSPFNPKSRTSLDGTASWGDTIKCLESARRLIYPASQGNTICPSNTMTCKAGLTMLNNRLAERISKLKMVKGPDHGQ